MRSCVRETNVSGWRSRHAIGFRPKLRGFRTARPGAIVSCKKCRVQFTRFWARPGCLWRLASFRSSVRRYYITFSRYYAPLDEIILLLSLSSRSPSLPKSSANFCLLRPCFSSSLLFPHTLPSDLLSSCPLPSSFRVRSLPFTLVRSFSPPGDLKPKISPGSTFIVVTLWYNVYEPRKYRGQ